MPCSPGNLLSWVELPPAAMLVPGEASRSMGWHWIRQHCHVAAAPSCFLPCVVFLTAFQLQHQRGGRAGHGQPWQGGSPRGCGRSGSHPGHPSAPALEQQLCRDLWKVWGSGHFQRDLCPVTGLAILHAAELTSTFTSNPLLFPGSSPISQLSIPELAADKVPGDEEHAVPPQGFSQALLPTFEQRGCLQGLCPHSHP